MTTLKPVWVAAIALGLASLTTACERKPEKGNERWVTTDNTNVDIDWNKINEAYKKAEGPEDFELKVNEIYEGSELISVAVRDENDKTQVVTGFFDRNGNGQAEDAEKVFTIKRDVVDDSKSQYQIQGYNHYAHYHSPMWDIAAGMVIGSMISRAIMPGYVYTTTPARRAAINTHRAGYRAKNPSRFSRSKTSTTGRSYGKKGGSWGSSGRGTSSRRSVRGGGFGIRDRKRRRTRQRLSS